MGQLSNRPDGDLQDGLPTGRDRVGLVESSSGNVDIFVDRLQRDQANAIWLFSSDTLREIPRLYDDVHPVWIEQYLPQWLQTIRWLSIPLYRWLALLLVIPLFFGLASLGTRVLTVSLRPLFRRITREQDASKLANLAPLRLLVLAVLCYGASLFGVTLTIRNLWQGLANVLTIIGLCWLSVEVMDVVSALTLQHLQRANRSGATALVRLVNRLSKAMAVVVAGLVLLYRSGIDLTTGPRRAGRRRVGDRFWRPEDHRESVRRHHGDLGQTGQRRR